MNGTAVTFVLLSATALLMLPRRWAPLPLLAGTCYMTVAQTIEIGPFTFTVLRILFAVGFIRVILRRESLTGRWNAVDSLIAFWGIWACASSAFHQDVPKTLVNHLGLVYNVLGIYFLLRIFCSSLDDVVWLCRISALVLLPIAFAMSYEQIALYNLFSIFGGVPETPLIRDGRVRAFGPFAHPILAGTVGGVTLPLMLGVWRHHRVSGTVGALACVTMVVASASSGPLMSAMFAVGAVCMWPFRRYMRAFRWMLVAAYVALMLVMERSPIYVIQRLEVVGGSTGWYRARLIESAIEHLDEWWLAGTDVTRHWMGIATVINEQHTDLTNHYIALGVMGGLPLMLMFIAALVKGYCFVGRGLQDCADEATGREFMLWAFGCSLTAHVVTCISVSYFDQSFLFLYLTLAVIASVGAGTGLMVAASGDVKRPDIEPKVGEWRRPQLPEWRIPSSRSAPAAVKVWNGSPIQDGSGQFSIWRSKPTRVGGRGQQSRVPGR